MNMQVIDRYTQMPARVLQSEEDMNSINYTNYYEIYWDGPNRDFGSFRTDPLKGNVAQGKRQVINILKAAYSTLSPRSFEETIKITKQLGIRIIHVQIAKGDRYEWLS